jgi:hypothetical protein
MSVMDWIWGIIRHPVRTYDLARQEMGNDFWLIIAAVLSLHVVTLLYGPHGPDGRKLAFNEAMLVAVMHLILLVQIQALLLMGTARVFGWRPAYDQTLKIVGLAWSVLLVQTVLAFYPLLKGMTRLLLWASLPLDVWYAIVVTFGVWRWGDVPLWRAGAITALAVIPLYLPLYWLQYIYMK